MPLELLLQEAKGMTDDAIMEVIHYMQFLKIAPARSTFDSISSKEKTSYRKPGLYKGQIIMADGFDDPLDEFKEYM